MPSSYWCTVTLDPNGSPEPGLAWTLSSVPSRTAPPDVAVTSTVGEGLLRVAARGELDLVTIPVLEVAVREVYWRTSRPRPGRFLLDLTGVTFLDISAVHVLDRIDKVVQDHGGRLDVTGPTACGPGHLLSMAVDFGWLPRVFAASRSTIRAT